MKDCNCIFCKIANGEIPSTTLYEDEDFRVILDLGPATRGHALLLPKNQTVFHFHMHLIPRYENDNAGILWEPGETTPEDMAEVKRLVDGE